MLSPFLKKLLFVRQFAIDNGKIEILGQQQIMLPSSAISRIQGNSFDIMKKEIKKSMEMYAKKTGGSAGGMVKSLQDIYETMGLGKMQIIRFVPDKGETNLRIMNINFKETELLEGVLCGLFSFLFEKDLSRKNIKTTNKTAHIEVVIK